MLFVCVVRCMRSVGVASSASCAVCGLSLLFAVVCCLLAVVVCRFGVLLFAVC